MKVRGTPGEISTGELRNYYDRRFAERPLRAREGFYRWIASHVPPAPESRIIDIACGGGYLLEALQGKNCTLFGCDFSSKAIKIASKLCPEAKLAVADGECLPYPDASFDIIYNLGSLEHFLDMHAGICEMHRVLKPEGRAVVMVPNSRYIGDLWRKATFRGGPDHHQLLERFGSLSEWKRLLESGGFRVKQVFPYNKFKRFLNLLPLTFAYCFVFTCTRA